MSVSEPPGISPPAAKVAILRKHLLEGQPVSQVCEEGGDRRLGQFYQWQEATFFENGAAAFESTRSRTAAADAEGPKKVPPRWRRS